MKDHEYVNRTIAVIEKYYPQVVALRSKNEKEYYRQGLAMVFELEQALKIKDWREEEGE